LSHFQSGDCPSAGYPYCFSFPYAAFWWTKDYGPGCTYAADMIKAIGGSGCWGLSKPLPVCKKQTSTGTNLQSSWVFKELGILNRSAFLNHPAYFPVGSSRSYRCWEEKQVLGGDVDDHDRRCRRRSQQHGRMRTSRNGANTCMRIAAVSEVMSHLASNSSKLNMGTNH